MTLILTGPHRIVRLKLTAHGGDPNNRARRMEFDLSVTANGASA